MAPQKFKAAAPVTQPPRRSKRRARDSAATVIASYKDGLMDNIHHAVIHNNNQDYESWRYARTPGNYLFRMFHPIDVEAACQTLAKCFLMTTEAQDVGRVQGHAPRIWMFLNHTQVSLTFHAEIAASVEEVLGTIEMTSPGTTVNWWYTDVDGDPTCSTLPLAGFSPKPEFYPWMPRPIDDFAQEFAASSANVLLLLGPPGTGKTSFIRGLVRAMTYDIWVTYDKKVQGSEHFYVTFSSVANSNDSGRVLVMEDADEMIGKRTDGNPLMNRILNVSDGLISLPARKIIFSTNLPGLQSIDEALLRPGRCFGVVKFRKLKYSEAQRACAAADVPLRSEAEEMTLSEALNGQRSTQAMLQIGFGA